MDPKDLAKHLVLLRKQKGMSLRQVSRKAVMSPAALSAIENGQSSPTLATLHKILRALGTNFADFFQEAQPQNSSPVFASANAATIEDKYRQYMFLFPKRDDLSFEMIHETISPTEPQSEWETHECDLGGHILSGGPAKLEIEGLGAWDLKKGDSFYVKAGSRHRLTNMGTKPLKQITVVDPPGYQR